jgi:hypothetical protein
MGSRRIYGKKNPDESPTSMNKNLADHFPSGHLESVLSVQEIHCKDQPEKKKKKYKYE